MKNHCNPPEAIRILVVYVTAGAGHRRAAEAIAQALTAGFPQATIQCHDLLHDVPAWLARAYPAVYYTLVRRLSRVWSVCFTLLDLGGIYALIQPIRRAWNLLVARQLIERLRVDPPDLVIVTHFFPADVVSGCKRAGWIRTPLVVIVTDLSPHRFWLSREAEAFIFATKDGAALAERRGVPPDRLHVIGIPIARGFSTPFDRGHLAQLFGLVPNRRTILVTSGGTTVGPFERVIEALIRLEDQLPHQLQLLIACGDDRLAVERLKERARASAMPMRVFGFIDTMPEAMAASDLVVAKAGGLTVTEALGRGVPLVLYHVIPGQEQLNAQYVSAHGAALTARRPAEVVAAVRRCIEHPEQLAAMRDAAKTISRPDAAAAIVSEVVKPLLQSDE